MERNKNYREQPASIIELNQFRLTRKVLGLSAVAAQVAHPQIAAGVLHHSKFMNNPVQRLLETETYMRLLCHGTDEQKETAAYLINHIHDRVHGTTVLHFQEGDQILERPVQYDAHDDDGKAWVAMTLLMNKFKIGDVMGFQYSEEKYNEYIDEFTSSLAPIGLNIEDFPQTYPALCKEYTQRIAGFDVSEEGKQITKLLIQTAPSLIPGFLGIDNQRLSKMDKTALAALQQVSGLLRNQAQIVTAGFLDENLREKYGMNWGAKEEKIFKLQKFLLKWVGPLMTVHNEVDPEIIQKLEGYRARMLSTPAQTEL